MTATNIHVHRYPIPTDEERAGWPEGVAAVSDHWQAWVEPDDGTWIMFVDTDGRPVLFSERDQHGAVTGEPQT